MDQQRDYAEEAYWQGYDEQERLWNEEITHAEGKIVAHLGEAIYATRRALEYLGQLTGHLDVVDYSEGVGGHDMLVHLQDAGRSLRAAQAIHHDLRQDLKKERQGMR